MNKVMLIGRLTKDPEIRQSQSGTFTARYTLAVDRFSKEKEADFINIVAFGKSAEFADKYLRKGTKVALEGRIQTGSYTNRDGKKVYTTDIIVERHEFCESRGKIEETPQAKDDGFMNIPETIDSDLPFH